MKVLCFPADNFGCGMLRMTWPARILAERGYDVTVVPPRERTLEMKVYGEVVRDLSSVDADVVVFQRVTHRFVAQVVPILRAKGIAVVVDIDDLLTSIDPRNPAWDGMHPRNEYRRLRGVREPGRHSWAHLTAACREATLVTVSTPALLPAYASHGRGHVLANCLPDHYYGLPRTDSGTVGWPASLVSHPDDPSAVGGAVARLVSDGERFEVVGDAVGTGTAFGLTADPPGRGNIKFSDWPEAVASIGVGIAPLVDTKFNAAKSCLKPLEMSACGVPWVASPRSEYARLNRMGAGVLADTPRRWYRELKRLTGSSSLREELSGRGREVAERFRLRNRAEDWMEAWTEAYRIQHAPAGAGSRLRVPHTSLRSSLP